MRIADNLLHKLRAVTMSPEWDIVSLHLDNRLKEIEKELRNADAPSFYKLQGKAQVLAELLNLAKTAKDQLDIYGKKSDGDEA